MQEKKQAEEQLDKTERTIKTVRPQVREFDEYLVRRLINTIRVNRRERPEIQFESGIVMEQMVDYYD